MVFLVRGIECILSSRKAFGLTKRDLCCFRNQQQQKAARRAPVARRKSEPPAAGACACMSLPLQAVTFKLEPLLFPTSRQASTTFFFPYTNTPAETPIHNEILFPRELNSIF